GLWLARPGVRAMTRARPGAAPRQLRDRGRVMRMTLAAVPDRTGAAGRRRGGRFANVTCVKTADNGSRTGLRCACGRGCDALSVLRLAVRYVAARRRRAAAGGGPEFPD